MASLAACIWSEWSPGSPSELHTDGARTGTADHKEAAGQARGLGVPGGASGEEAQGTVAPPSRAKHVTRITTLPC